MLGTSLGVLPVVAGTVTGSAGEVRLASSSSNSPSATACIAEDR